jgi:hypothetical protein
MERRGTVSTRQEGGLARPGARFISNAAGGDVTVALNPAWGMGDVVVEAGSLGPTFACIDPAGESCDEATVGTTAQVGLSATPVRISIRATSSSRESGARTAATLTYTPP